MVKKLKIKNDKKKGKSSKNFEIQKIKKLIKNHLKIFSVHLFTKINQKKNKKNTT